MAFPPLARNFRRNYFYFATFRLAPSLSPIPRRNYSGIEAEG